VAARDGGVTTRDARPASTVLVARDGADGIEIYMQRRPASMAFVGGLWVFPGGRVDAADSDPAIDAVWDGPAPTAWADVMDIPVALARGHVVAAYRETLEESGILLAAGSPRPDDLAAARRALLDDETAFAEVVESLGVRLDTTLLGYWDWWVTPASEPRRYDTRFFVARLPADATVTAHEDEVIEERWAVSGDAHDLAMIAPTFHTLRSAQIHPSVDALLAAATARSVTAVQPVIEDGHVVLPDGERFPLPDGFGGA
jgi:8-oxo-dGTP pyrophosphatase MutT (NUDIX family)